VGACNGLANELPQNRLWLHGDANDNRVQLRIATEPDQATVGLVGHDRRLIGRDGRQLMRLGGGAAPRFRLRTRAYFGRSQSNVAGPPSLDELRHVLGQIGHVA
jgi:hypothetical protein